MQAEFLLNVGYLSCISTVKGASHKKHHLIYTFMKTVLELT